MFYRKNIDTQIRVSKDSIYIKKGKFNYSHLEIRKNDQITNKLLDKLVKFFNEINIKGKAELQVSKNEELLTQIVQYLLQFNFLIKDETYESKFDEYFYISDNIKNKDIIKKISGDSAEVIDLIEFEKLENVNRIPIFTLSNFNYQNWIKINKKLLKLKLKGLFLLVDGDFFHLFMVNNDYSGCLECFFLRMGSRIKEYSIFENIINSENIMENNMHNGILEFGLSLAKMILNAQKINNSFFIESKILSIYIPTIEIHVDKLLKMSSCSSCGYYSKLQSNEMNINTIETIRGLIKDEK